MYPLYYGGWGPFSHNPNWQGDIFTFPYLYTIVYHKLYEAGIDYSKMDTHDMAIAAAPLIFDFSFPFYDEGDRISFEVKFIEHFWYERINYNTYGVFRQRLQSELNLKMPYYNKLYLSEIKLLSTDITKTYTGSETQETASESKGLTTNNATDSNKQTSGSNQVYSDTPQSRLRTDTDYATNINNATNTQDSESVAESTSQNDNNAKIITKINREGNSGIPITTLTQGYRDTILNVDMVVYNDLASLFLQVYDC